MKGIKAPSITSAISVPTPRLNSYAKVVFKNGLDEPFKLIPPKIVQSITDHRSTRFRRRSRPVSELAPNLRANICVEVFSLHSTSSKAIPAAGTANGLPWKERPGRQRCPRAGGAVLDA
jgi:hypothetical protein